MAISKEIQKLVDERIDQYLTLDTNYTKTLDLSNLQLQKIPNQIFEIETSISLDLSRNCICDLPKDFEKLQNLQNLQLEKNWFDKFPLILTELLNLQYLDLGFNSILVIPKEVLSFKSLIELHLYNNKIQIPTLKFDFNTSNFTTISHWLREYYQKENPKQNILKIPEQLKTSIKQYLNFFPDFVLQSKGVKINFEVTTVDEGLSLQIDEKEEETLNQINAFLQEYMGFLQNKNETIDILFTKQATDFEKELLITQQEVQINNLKNALVIKKLENSYLTEVLKQPILLSNSLIETLHNATLEAKNNLEANNLPVPYIKDGFLWQQMPDGKHIQLEKLEPLKSA